MKTYLRNFPVGTKPLRVDTISFEEATVEETVEFFQKEIIKYKGALTAANLRQLDEGKLITEQRKVISLREELLAANTIINYLERKCNEDLY